MENSPEMADMIQKGITEAFDARELARAAGNKETEVRADEGLAKYEELANRFNELEAAQLRLTSAAEEQAEQRAVESFDLDAQIRSASNGQEIQVRADDYNTGTADAAGRLIQNVFQTNIVDKQFNMGAIYANATKIQIAGNQLTMPFQKTDFEVEDVAETGAREKTTVAEFGDQNITLGLAHSTVLMTPEMLEDSHYPLESWVLGKVGDAFARHWAAKHVAALAAKVGTTADDATVINTVETAGTTLTRADLTKLEASMRQGYLVGSKFYTSRSGVQAIADIAGPDSRLITEIPASNGVGMQRKVLGYDIVVDDFMPAFAPGAVFGYFGDMASALTIVEKRALTLQRLNERHIPYIGLYATARQGTGLENGQALRAFKVAAA